MKQNMEMSSMREKCRFKGEVFAVKVGDTSICFYVGGNDRSSSGLCLACLWYGKDEVKYLHALVGLECWNIILRSTLGKTLSN